MVKVSASASVSPASAASVALEVVAGAVLVPVALAVPLMILRATLSPAIALPQAFVSTTWWTAVFVNVQVTSSPAASVTELADTDLGVQVKDVCWYPAGPLSASVYCPGATCTRVTVALFPAPDTGVGPVAVSAHRLVLQPQLWRGSSGCVVTASGAGLVAASPT